MTTSGVDLSPDAKGVLTLTLRGDWSAKSAAALSNLRWDRLSIFGVSWPDFSPLQPFKDKIEWLSVSIGPDSSRGLEDLTQLKQLQLFDIPKPQPDLRVFPRLESVDVLLGKAAVPDLIANPHLRSLAIQELRSRDLSWASSLAGLTSLHVKGGSTPSLNGIETLTQLREFVSQDLYKCTDVAAITRLQRLRVLELDAPNARMPNIDWLQSMPELERLKLFAIVDVIDWARIGANRKLKSVTLSTHEGYDLSDAEILSQVSTGGSKVKTFKRFPSKAPGFALELE